MNNLLYFRKRMTEAQAHDYVSTKHRVEMEREITGFNRFMWKWLTGLAIIVFLVGVGAAMACEPVESETIKIMVDGV